MWTVATIVAIAVSLGGFLLLVWLGRWGERWGATPEEFATRMTGDAWLEGGPRARVRMTRATWVEAPVEQVWPWLAQMGRGAGWYSYDRLDNGGRASARHLVSWIPDARLGDAAAIGYLRHLEPGRELAWWLKGGRFFGAYLRGAMLYRVTGDGARSRLVVRIQADARGRLAALACWLFRIVDSIMARRQILGIKDRAERFGTRGEDREHPETGARDQFQLYQAIYASGVEVGVPGRGDASTWRRAAIDDGVISTDRLARSELGAEGKGGAMREVGSVRKIVIVLAHAVVGWAFCGALIGVGRRFLSMDATLVLHAIGAPVGFGLLTVFYQRRFAFTGPLRTALIFLGVVIGLDLVLVAPLFEKSFAMFASPLGTWIPFALIFLATYLTSLAVGAASSGKP